MNAVDLGEPLLRSRYHAYPRRGGRSRDLLSDKYRLVPRIPVLDPFPDANNFRQLKSFRSPGIENDDLVRTNRKEEERRLIFSEDRIETLSRY